MDEPGDPPCQRCRREKKLCTFSETRRKRKADKDGENGDLSDEYLVRNKRASIANDGVADASGQFPDFFDGQDDSMLLGLDGSKKGAANRQVKNEKAAELFVDPIIGSHDAMSLLVKAATNTEEDDKAAVQRAIENTEVNVSTPEPRRTSAPQQPDVASPIIDPAIMDHNPPTATARADEDWDNAIKAWSDARFVHAGMLTPEEGIAYIQYFYDNLSPLSPVLPPDFSSPRDHPKLLEEEPMLTVTLLTIASRYMQLKGPGGVSRTFWMHDKLWKSLQEMITRMFWGQEQFGGGFCGAGNIKTGEAEARRRGLRSLGTIESLLLLSDWLPRAMHFPPSDDGDGLLVRSAAYTDPARQQRSSQHAWAEPAIRSDRMCWSLVGMAHTLAFELGVFDSLVEDGHWRVGPQEKTFYAPERADRIGRMLFVYVTQACGRLGFPNMMPHEGSEQNLDFLRMDIPAGTYSELQAA